MNEHVTPWLGAYHDGELKGHRLRQVEAHLSLCTACSAELEQLQMLRGLLQEHPVAEGLLPAERFVAQVGLRMVRRPEKPAWQRVLETGWRLMSLYSTYHFFVGRVRPLRSLYDDLKSRYPITLPAFPLRFRLLHRPQLQAEHGGDLLDPPRCQVVRACEIALNRPDAQPRQLRNPVAA